MKEFLPKTPSIIKTLKVFDYKYIDLGERLLVECSGVTSRVNYEHQDMFQAVLEKKLLIAEGFTLRTPSGRDFDGEEAERRLYELRDLIVRKPPKEELFPKKAVPKE